MVANDRKDVGSDTYSDGCKTCDTSKITCDKLLEF